MLLLLRRGCEDGDLDERHIEILTALIQSVA